MKIRIQANPCFRDVDRSDKRYIVMKGSAGSGKSVDTAQNYILRLMRDKGRNLVCIRKSDITNRDSTFAELTGAIYRMFGDQAERYWQINMSPLQLTCKANGNKIIFRGMNDDKQREKLKSITFQRGKLTDVWCEEATELTQADVEIIDDRLRGELPPGQFYQIRMTFNPVNKNHWIKKVFFDMPDDNVLTHHSTYLMNRFIDDAYKARMERRKAVDPEGYQIYGLGELQTLKERAEYFGLDKTKNFEDFKQKYLKAAETPIAQVNTFTPAKTIEDAAKFAKETLGLEQTTAYQLGMNLDVANGLNEAIGRMSDTFGSLTEAGYLENVLLFTNRSSNSYAAYSDSLRTVFLNPVVKQKGALKKMAKDAVEQFEPGAWSTGSAFHTVYHELGHAVQHMILDNNALKKNKTHCDIGRSAALSI